MAVEIRPSLGKLMTAGEAAVYLGISESHMRHLIRDRQIAVMRNDNGRMIGIYRADCDEWQQRRRVPAQRTVLVEERVRTAGVDAAMQQLIGGHRVFAH